jgi:hypothetical protein
MKRRCRIAIYIGLSVIGILLALVAGLFGVLQTGYARDQLRQRIADATAGSSTAVQLDAIGRRAVRHAAGRPSPSGRNGPADTVASLPGRSPPLLAARLQVDLHGGPIDVARAPAERLRSRTSRAADPRAAVTIDLRRLSVERVVLAAPILGERPLSQAHAQLENRRWLGGVSECATAKATPARPPSTWPFGRTTIF